LGYRRIRMQEQEHVTGGHRGARIHLRCASPRRIEDAYVRTCGEDGATGIAAAAVDRDDFGVTKGVDGALETSECHRQRTLLVENRNDHGDLHLDAAHAPPPAGGRPHRAPAVTYARHTS